MKDLFRRSAREVSGLLRRREVSPVEAVHAALERIAATDGALNAVPTVCAERALAHARRIESEGTAGRPPAWLGGLPIVVKDLNDVAGVRTTYGSPLFADHVPEASDVMVETLEANGAVVVGKANTPEFGHGANTYNEVFGKTRNPWNTAMTCGGSSGGSAVAVATGQAWLATGSDLGCSLRTPAAFCSVVGLRPSPGRVARSRVRLPFDTLWVQGPLARDVGDVALMLDAMSGHHPADPLSMDAPRTPFRAALEQPVAPRRVAYSRDLGGLTPVAAEVAQICAAA
ncbi:MAG: amidase family protein, partial [Usitatibacter sp.]